MHDRCREDPADSGADLGIGQFAVAAGVSVETVRYYERRGLLDAPTRTPSGYRRYTTVDLDRLRLLLRAKELGFTLREIADLLAASASRSIPDVTAAVHAKLAAIDAQLADLASMRCRLRRLVDLCQHGDDAACLQLQSTG
jgi:MerR family mercuric resistance operon transcriptional regulator